MSDDRPPGFFLWIRDLLTDPLVELMDTTEFGAYLLLLCKAWFQDPPGSIPDDDFALSRWAKLTPDRWSECKPRVMAPWKLQKDGRWHQKRMRQEFAKAIAYQAKKSKAGTIAAKARWEHEHARRIADAMQTQCDGNTNSCHPKPKPIEKRTTARAEPAGLTGKDMFEIFWASYPLKIHQLETIEAWRTIKPDRSLLDRMLAALDVLKDSDKWLEDGGRYIPAPDKWLNEKRWEQVVIPKKPRPPDPPGTIPQVECYRNEQGHLIVRDKAAN